MSNDQDAATVMEEIQKMRQEMIDLKSQVKSRRRKTGRRRPRKQQEMQKLDKGAL